MFIVLVDCDMWLLSQSGNVYLNVCSRCECLISMCCTSYVPVCSVCSDVHHMWWTMCVLKHNITCAMNVQVCEMCTVMFIFSVVLCNGSCHDWDGVLWYTHIFYKAPSIHYSGSMARLQIQTRLQVYASLIQTRQTTAWRCACINS